MKAAGIFLFCMGILFALTAAPDTTSVSMKISKTPPIPPATGKMVQHGIAGPVTGISNSHLIVGGGANFEDKLPWHGGAKSYHNKVYVLEQKKNGAYNWSQPDTPLPQLMAYSACVSVSRGILSMGGETPQGPVADVYLFKYRHHKLVFRTLPSLPQPIACAGAAAIGNTIYVTGGLNGKGAAVAEGYVMDVSARKPAWKAIASLPVSLSHAVTVAQSDGRELCLYVIGGRYRDSEVTTFLSTVYKYSPSRDAWEKVADITVENGEKMGLSAGTGAAYLDKYIVIFGGDNGTLFNKTERFNNALATLPEGSERQKLLKQKDDHLTNHPGLYRKVLLFNTVSLKWEVLGEIPQKIPVTTTAFWWNQKVYIPSGEVKPGIRTDEVLEIELKEKLKTK